MEDHKCLQLEDSRPFFDEKNYKDENESGSEKTERGKRRKISSRKCTSEIDSEIRTTDILERMQFRDMPIMPTEEGTFELDDEAEWIYQHAFLKSSLLMHDCGNETNKPNSTVAKIKEALDFIRNQQLEVPFISLYRKEFVEPELNMNDLWQVYYYDGKWSKLFTRRLAYLKMYEKVSDKRLEKDMNDLYQISNSGTQEELNDISKKFALYYFRDESAPESMKYLVPIEYDDVIYDLYRRNNILKISEEFGLTPLHFAENLHAGYMHHTFQQKDIELSKLAVEYIEKSKLKTVDVILSAAKFVVSRQIAREPLVNRSVRKTFYKTARISVSLTEKGQSEFGENHFCFTVKNKPVRELTGDQFLRLVIAEQKKQLKIFISEEVEGNSSNSYLEEAMALYQSDELSVNAQDWNKFRSDCVNEALKEIVFPKMRKELKYILINEAKDSVLKQCRQKLHDWINIAPYTVDFTEKFGLEWDSNNGIRAMGLAYVPDHTQAVFCAATNGDFELAGSIYIKHILSNKLTKGKELGLMTMRNFIRANKPHVIVIGGESLEAMILQKDVQEICRELGVENHFPSIQVQIIDNELARMYSQSKKGTADFRFHPTLLRQAVSLARRIQDPLVEFSQLCTFDEEILCLRYHSLQDQLPKKQLLEGLYLEFINRTNEVGINVNLSLHNSRKANLVQFACGSGLQKHLLKE